MMKQEPNYEALIAKQQTEIIRLQHETNGYLRDLVEMFRPKTNKEVLQEMKAESPHLFDELVEVKLRETDLGEIVQEYARREGMTEDEYLNHTQHVAKQIVAELDAGRQRTIEENRSREAKRAELMRQANELWCEMSEVEQQTEQPQPNGVALGKSKTQQIENMRVNGIDVQGFRGLASAPALSTHNSKIVLDINAFEKAIVLPPELANQSEIEVSFTVKPVPGPQ